jgi:hypothetical protein
MKIKQNTTALPSFRDDNALCAASSARAPGLTNPHLALAHFILAPVSIVCTFM